MNLELLHVFQAEQVGFSTNRAAYRYPETLRLVAKNLAEYPLKVLNMFCHDPVKLRYSSLWR
jgi:hypothetical protein